MPDGALFHREASQLAACPCLTLLTRACVHAAVEMRFEGNEELGYDPLGVPPKGEICLRGPMIFSGYYKDKAKTEEAFGALPPSCGLCLWLARVARAVMRYDAPWNLCSMLAHQGRREHKQEELTKTHM